MLAQFHTYGLNEWLSFLLVIPVYYLVFIQSRKLVQLELKQYLVTSFAIKAAGRVTPIIMSVVYLVFSVLFLTRVDYSSLQDAVSAQKQLVSDMTGSAVVFEISQLMAVYNGLKEFAISRLSELDATAALIGTVFGTLIVFYNASAMLSCFLIPRSEFLRIFAPITQDADIPKISPSRVAFTAAVTTFIILFIYVPLFPLLEAHFRRKPAWIEFVRSQVKIIEQIGDLYVKQGTIEKIEAEKIKVLLKFQSSNEQLIKSVDAGFNLMTQNVDLFLNWYYSLPAEYGRLIKLMSGNLEDYLAERLKEFLSKGDPFGEVESEIKRVMEEHKEILERFKRTVDKIIQENRVTNIDPGVEVARKTTLTEALSPPIHNDKIDFSQRIGSATVLGSVTALVSAKVLSKAIGKATIKNAAQIVAKVVGGKAVGSAGGYLTGMAGGAAIGSIFPGIGTAIGAVAGGIIGGVATGIAIDKVVLLLEEAFSREDFRKELISSIEAARTEFKANVNLNIPAPSNIGHQDSHSN
jgi:hypothetical protein